MGLFDGITLEGILSASVRMAAPLLLASLGGLFTARVGITNLALEGMMLVGALCGFVGAVATGGVLGGAVFAMLGGMLTASILAFLSVTAKANQTVAGVGINITALGFTSYFYRVYFGTELVYGIPTAHSIEIPLLSQIPVLGVFFRQTGLTYLAFLLVPVIWYFLYRTPVGLALRATGEHPRAVDTLGGNVVKIRYLSTLAAGMLVGLGGACLTIGETGQFVENITAGKGYIALATLIFGKYTPVGSLLASLLFGFSEGLQLRLQTAGSEIPFQLLSMLPYLLTMIASASFVRKAVTPDALGKPYSRQG